MRVALTNEEGSKHHVLADLKLPDHVAYALEYTPELSIKQDGQEIYPAIVNGVHTAGPGLIFQRTLKTRFPQSDTDKTRLTFRVSYGWDVGDSNQRCFWNGAKANRFHISINAERRFFPENWKDHPHYIGSDDPNKIEYLVALEEMNVSLRWTSEAFETHWNEKFNVSRSTYARVNPDFALQTPKEVLHQTGRAERVVPFPRDSDPKTTMIKGYTPVFNTLRKFDESTMQHNGVLEKITQEEGIGILFGQVRPCIEKYIAL